MIRHYFLAIGSIGILFLFWVVIQYLCHRWTGIGPEGENEIQNSCGGCQTRCNELGSDASKKVL